MLRVECESCKAPYQVDERRIPATGLKMRCPKCGHTFVVRAGGAPPAKSEPQAGGAPAAAPSAPRVDGGAPATAPKPRSPEATRALKQTMMGIAGPGGFSKPPLPGGTPGKPPIPGGAAKPPVPGKPPAPGRPPVQQTPGYAWKPEGPATSPARPAVMDPLSDLPSPAQAKGAGAKRMETDLPAALGSLDEADLPITAQLKATPKGAKPPPPVPRTGLAAAAKAPSTPSSDELEIDLPLTTNAARRQREQEGLELDLPSPVADLPAPAAANVGLPVARGSAPGLPSPKVGPAPRAPATAPTPAARATPPRSLGLDFGEIDLPTVGGDNPSLATNLPMVADALPAVASALPAAANALPILANALPSAAGARPPASPELDLGDAFEDLPPAAEPAKVPSLRAEKVDGAGLADGLGEFGELDLPPPPARTSGPGNAESLPPLASLPPLGSIPPVPSAGEGPRSPSVRPPASSGLGAWGEVAGFELTSDPPPAAAPAHAPARAAPPPPPQAPPPAPAEVRATGGASFGEVDLGGDGPSASLFQADVGGGEASLAGLGSLPPGAGSGGASVRPSGGAASLPPPGGGSEVALPEAQKGQQSAQGPAPQKGRRILGRVLLGVGALVVLSGGALELTPYGAFGRLPIADALHAAEYARTLNELSSSARKRASADVYPEARAAADDLARAHAAAPRNRPLAAYAALVELETQLRFGSDSERGARARQWLAEIPAGKAVRNEPVAKAVSAAVAGELAEARTGLDAASKRDTADPVQEDIAFARGEVELLARDSTAAIEAFNQALKLRPGARAHFGLARAYALAEDEDNAQKQLEATLAASSAHAGAHVLRAELAWERHRDEALAMAELAKVLGGDAKASASPFEEAQAHAVRGWIHAGRGRSAEARADFDAALKLQSRNVHALLGQGEVLYNEGRYTEALTRFDTAVQADPTSVDAILSDAKAKIALERLNDAKKQLTEAQAARPKNGRLAYWLGRTLEALGDKGAAEKAYTTAIDLVDVARPDAIEPYVALSGLLAGQGRAKEAQAKLDEARGKLPDSAAMEHALGEVAAAQGQYDQAVAHFRDALTKDPTDLATRFRLGVTLRRMRKTDEAAVEFDKVLAADKDYPGLAVERGLLYEESGDVDKALEQFQSALAKAPDDPDLQLRVGAAYAAIGRPADAIPTLRKVLDKRPNSAEANHYLGRALFQQGGKSAVEAMRYLKRAVELDPNRAEYHLYVAWAANNASPPDLGLAREEIDKALALDKLLADGYWQRGVLERKQGAVEDAIRDLKHALELRPTRTEAHAALGECYEDKNDRATALVEWRKAVASNDQEPEWRYRLGSLLLDRGAASEAAKHLAFAAAAAEKMEIHPGWIGGAEFAAGEALRKTGKRAEAIERYRRFLEVAPANSPDRRDAINALSDLGSPWNPGGIP